jgi:hypothetical protein
MSGEIHTHASARDSAQERESVRHNLTIKTASALFATFGVPRSPRSVQGFCKDGHIDCIRAKGPSGDRYFINQKSVEQYATELKQIEVVGKIASDEPAEQEREFARGSAQERAAVASERVSNHSLSDDHAEPSTDIIKALRDEILNLRIDNRAKEQFINQLVEDRNSLMQSVQDVNYRLGAADARVQQLEGPRELARDSAHERAEEREAEVDAAVGLMEVSDTQPESVVDVLVSLVDTPKRSFLGRIFCG